jgi:hypothetical protein
MKRAGRGAIGSCTILFLVGLGDSCGFGAISGLVIGGMVGLLTDTVLQAGILGLLLGATFGPVGTYLMVIALIPRGL